MTDLSVFQQKLKERREREMAAAQATKKDEVPSEFADLIPEDDTGYERSEDDVAIDRLISGITVDQAYDRWIRKPRPRERSGKREGVMISCPMPNHADKNPSAWMNLDKDTWYCAGCDQGGDVLDLASIHFGIPDYKAGENFGRLRETIAEDFGFTRIFAPGLPREGALVAPESEEDGTPAEEVGDGTDLPSTAQAAEEVSADSDTGSDSGDGGTVSYLPEGLAATLGDEDTPLPSLAWRELVEPGTFLDAYMAACVVDDVPEEYHFWHGLMALGLAVGRDVTLYDSQPVLANLFVCTLGRTGVGKSRAASYLRNLLFQAIPDNDDKSRGVKLVPTPGSAEVLIKSFVKPVYEPPIPGKKPAISHYVPVRGLVEFSELSALVGRSGRAGSVLQPVLMQFFDGDSKVSTSSLSHGEHVADDAYASLLTSTQPKALTTLLSQNDADSGFLNRWVFATGTEKRRVAVGGTRIDLTQAVIKLHEIWTWADYDPSTGDEPLEVQWSEEAELLFSSFFHEHIERVKRGNGDDEREFFQRLDLITKKLILLFTINEKLQKVPVQAVEKAIKIFWYLVKVLEIPSRTIGISVQTELERDIINLVEKYEEKNGKDGGCPLYYITKILSKKKVYTRDMITRALKTLSDLNELNVEVPTKRSGPGRPPVARYRLAAHE